MDQISNKIAIKSFQIWFYNIKMAIKSFQIWFCNIKIVVKGKEKQEPFNGASSQVIKVVTEHRLFIVVLNKHKFNLNCYEIR